MYSNSQLLSMMAVILDLKKTPWRFLGTLYTMLRGHPSNVPEKFSFYIWHDFQLMFLDSNPANTQRNKRVIITSKRRFGVTITCLLRFVYAGKVYLRCLPNVVKNITPPNSGPATRKRKMRCLFYSALNLDNSCKIQMLLFDDSSCHFGTSHKKQTVTENWESSWCSRCHSGGTVCCHNDKFWCIKWRYSLKHDNSRFPTVQFHHHNLLCVCNVTHDNASPQWVEVNQPVPSLHLVLVMRKGWSIRILCHLHQLLWFNYYYQCLLYFDKNEHLNIYKCVII